MSILLCLVTLTIVQLAGCLPMQAGWNGREEGEARKKRGAAPCFDHEDCLITQVCAWDPSVVELAGTCVNIRHNDRPNPLSTDPRFSELRHRDQARFRREILSLQRVEPQLEFEQRVRRQMTVDDYGIDHQERPDDEIAGVELTREDSSRKAERIQSLRNTQSVDDGRPLSDSSVAVPLASFPLRHKISDPQGDHALADDQSDNDFVIDHFDEKGIPVVVIREDNRNVHADYDTNKDVNVFGDGMSDDESVPEDRAAEVGSISLDYSEDGDGGYDGERRKAYIDLSGGDRMWRFKSLLSNPWGLQPITDMLRGDNDMVNESRDYLTDDVEVYGAGDDREGKPRMAHHDTDAIQPGSGIEMDVGVNDVNLHPGLPSGRTAEHAE